LRIVAEVVVVVVVMVAPPPPGLDPSRRPRDVCEVSSDSWRLTLLPVVLLMLLLLQSSCWPNAVAGLASN